MLRADSLESLLHLGLLGKAASGNNLLDVVLILAASAAWSFASRAINSRMLDDTAWEALNYWFTGKCIRIVKHTYSSSIFGRRGDSDVHNSVLQKAIMVYANRDVPNPFCAMRRGYLTLAETNRDMRVMNAGNQSAGRRDCEDDDDDDRSPPQRVRTRMILSPCSNKWTPVEKGVRGGAPYEILIKKVDSFEDTEEGKIRNTTEELHVMGRCPRDPVGLVGDFVTKAYAHYRAELQREVENNKRFLFALTGGPDGDAGQNGAPIFSKNELSDERGLDTIYHERIGDVRRVLDEFVSGTGKFSVPGHPYKLGFLLHGSPGCGKTSLIKAVAAHTKRHVVSVGLDAVRSNCALEQIMNGNKYKTQSGTISIPTDEVIFVMEDVDAACGAVHRRSASGSPPDTPSAGDMATAIERAVVSNIEGLKKQQPAAPASTLTLSGILNVMDGLQDSPGRIVIMTTNHPEKLDPALIRPGRVTMSVRMERMLPDHAVAMVSKYFTGASFEDLKALRARAEASPPFPALLETLCGSMNSVGAVIQQLNEPFSPEAVLQHMSD